MKRNAQVAYFSMEFGIEGLPFGGGLGILAGDFIKSCADLGLPVIGIGLLYNQGNFHQKLSDDGQQTEWYERFDPTGRGIYRGTGITVPIEGREVRTNAFEFAVAGERSIVPLLLLDTEGNNHHRPWDDNICNVLYPSEHPYQRLTQEQVLGTGGPRTLDALGYNILINHLNEGHPALATIELIKKYGSVEEAKKHIVFTTHTSVPAGFDRFSKELTEQVLGKEVRDYASSLTEREELDMTRLAMALASQSFAVSPLHAQVSRYVLNGSGNVNKLFSIDNGIHLPTWTAPEVQKLFERLTNGEWRTNPQVLERVLSISDEEAIEVHRRSRERLGEFLRCDDPHVKGYGQYDPEKLTIGSSRRIAGYKQPTLLFENIDRLRRLGKYIQIVLAGKAHPRDEGSKESIKEIFRFMKELEGQVSVWFIGDYNMQTAKYLVRGSDLWLNTPMRLLEASGSSGMKANANFVPQISIPDGWWMPQDSANGYRLPKGYIEGVTGWGIGRIPTEEDFLIFLNGDEQSIRSRRDQDRKNDAENLYEKLEGEIIPLFTRHKTGTIKSWARVMKGATAHNAPWFNSHRMAIEYFERAYQIPVRELITS